MSRYLGFEAGSVIVCFITKLLFRDEIKNLGSIELDILVEKES